MALNPLARGRLRPLTDDESKTVAQVVAHDLFVAWGDADDNEQRPMLCDLELAQLGLLAKDSEIVASCGPAAVVVLQEGLPGPAAALGQTAIRLLDTQQRAVPWRLLSETARALTTLGDGFAVDALLDRGAAALREQRALGVTIDPLAAGFLVYEQARRRMLRGEMTEAESLFREASELAKNAGQEISATIALDRIAEILTSRGEVDEAYVSIRRPY